MSRLENIDFRKLERIITLSGQTIWVVSIEGRIVEAVGALVHELGYRPDELTGRPIRELIHPGDLDLTARKFLEVASDSSASNNVELELRVTGKQGDRFEVKVNATAYERDGQPLEVIALTTDITRQRIAERTLHRERTRFQRTFEQAPSGILLLHIDSDRGGLVKQANAAACRISGRRMDDLVGRWLSDGDLTETSDPEIQDAALEAEAMFNGDTGGFEVKRILKKPDGEKRIMKAAVSALEVDPWEMIMEEHPVNAIVHIEDITEENRASVELERQANHDSLTELLNRGSFIGLLDTRLRQHVSGDGDGGALFMIDLDGFKQVNDTYGHMTGDRVLKEVAGLLKASLRKTDVVARLGGDEFAILLPGADRDAAIKVARQIQESFENARIQTCDSGAPVVPSVSMGLIVLKEQISDAESALRECDRAMYEAKRKGGGRFVLGESEGS